MIFALLAGFVIGLFTARDIFRDVGTNANLSGDILYVLWLYVDWRYVTKQLTTDQREFWADVIDEAHQRQDREEGTTGTDRAFEPVDRWWRG